MVLPCYYNAPVSYFSLLLQHGNKTVIEQFDHYSKQTYRNRCRILGANGVINLVIPIVKVHGTRLLMKDVRIDYDTKWQHNHWRSISSAYSSAPFFEFINDSFIPFYLKHYKFLADFNFELLRASLSLFGRQMNLDRTETYHSPEPGTDISEVIHPKKAFRHHRYAYHPIPYHQVFSDRHGFVSELSILDLLFNEGSNAGKVLSDSILVK
ncbi:MAG: WbqC family protein [Bacteroidales bacterium]